MWKINRSAQLFLKSSSNSNKKQGHPVLQNKQFRLYGIVFQILGGEKRSRCSIKNSPGNHIDISKGSDLLNFACSLQNVCIDAQMQGPHWRTKWDRVHRRVLRIDCYSKTKSDGKIHQPLTVKGLLRQMLTKSCHEPFQSNALDQVLQFMC